MNAPAGPDTPTQHKPVQHTQSGNVAGTEAARGLPVRASAGDPPVPRASDGATYLQSLSSNTRAPVDGLTAGKTSLLAARLSACSGAAGKPGVCR